MKNLLFCNLAIFVFSGLFNLFCSRGRIQIIPIEEIDNNDFNPFKAFLNMDKMTKELMSIYK